MTAQETFQRRVLEELEKRGWSRADLARALDVTPTRVTQILTWDKSPRLDLIERVAKALGVPVWKLLK